MYLGFRGILSKQKFCLVEENKKKIFDYFRFKVVNFNFAKYILIKNWKFSRQFEVVLLCLAYESFELTNFSGTLKTLPVSPICDMSTRWDS